MSNASGDDEELKRLLDTYERAVLELWILDALTARAAVESLFGRIKEERDRAVTERKINALTFEQKYILGRVAHLLVGTEDGLPIEWEKLIPAAQALCDGRDDADG